MDRLARLATLGTGLILTAMTASAAGQPPSFEGLGFLPGASSSYATAISADGRVVVGHSRLPPQTYTPFRWTRSGGMTPLAGAPAPASAYAVSADGSAIAGGWWSSGVAFRWTAATGAVPLTIPDVSYPIALAISGDGATVGGTWTFLATWPAWYWTAQSGGVILPNNPAFPLRDNAVRAINAEGSVLVGQAGTPGDFAVEPGACLWHTNGPAVMLGSNARIAYAISPDGAVIVGQGVDDFGAFRWTESDGVVPLGGNSDSAYGVSGDGQVIVGTTTNPVGFIWTPTGGVRDLQSVLACDFGLDVRGWSGLAAMGISADGRTLAGTGTNPQGAREAWIAVIPRCAADADGDGTVAPADIAAFVQRWFTSLAEATLAGDFNGDGAVEPGDVAAFVGAWFAGLNGGC